jgi:hypothetical protein
MHFRNRCGRCSCLSYEGMSPSRARKLLGPPERYRFVFGRGMISDDTDHTCMVAQSLIESGDNVDTFTRRFASRLRWWILALPAGVGNATARSCINLWLGIRPAKSGVYSAGNGPAMRAAIFGATIDDVLKLLEYVRASSRLLLRSSKYVVQVFSWVDARLSRTQPRGTRTRTRTRKRRNRFKSITLSGKLEPRYLACLSTKS